MCGEGCYGGSCGGVEEVSPSICEMIPCYNEMEKMCVLTLCGYEERIHMKRSRMKCTSWKMFESGEATLFRSSCVDDGGLRRGDDE